MSGWEVVGVFVGIPLLVLVLIALPIFGPVWWTALRRPRGSADQDGAVAPPSRPSESESESERNPGT